MRNHWRRVWTYDGLLTFALSTPMNTLMTEQECKTVDFTKFLPYTFNGYGYPWLQA